MVQQSVQDFHNQMKKYRADVTERIKHATKATADYGFVRKPELRHQYGMLFSPQVKSSLD